MLIIKFIIKIAVTLIIISLFSMGLCGWFWSKPFNIMNFLEAFKDTLFDFIKIFSAIALIIIALTILAGIWWW